jgi:hypothetical protein
VHGTSEAVRLLLKISRLHSQSQKRARCRRVVGKPKVIQMGIERIKDEPFGKSRLIARRVTRYFVVGLSASYST